jgi:septum site-determining protein MinD
MVGGVGKSTPPPRSAPRWRRPGRRSQWSISMSACANLDLLMGASRRGVFDLRRPERREAFASPHPRQTGRNAVAPAGLADRDKGALTEQGVAGVIKELCGKFDWVICDSPAGIERGATLAMRFADIDRTNREVASVRDSDRVMGLLDPKTEKAEKGQRVHPDYALRRTMSQ